MQNKNNKQNQKGHVFGEKQTQPKEMNSATNDLTRGIIILAALNNLFTKNKR